MIWGEQWRCACGTGNLFLRKKCRDCGEARSNAPAVSAPTPSPVAPETYALALLAEEMGEALQQVGKALRFGLDTPAGDPAAHETSRDQLADELGHVQAAIDFATLHGLVGLSHVQAAYHVKLARLCDPAATDNLGRRLAPAVPGRRS